MYARSWFSSCVLSVWVWLVRSSEQNENGHGRTLTAFAGGRVRMGGILAYLQSITDGNMYPNSRAFSFNYWIYN
jgi:hypothetical protein